MKEYCVYVPIVGFAVVYVEAENEESAKERALDEAELKDIEEWEAVEHVTEGNVFHGPRNDIEIEEQ